MRRDEMINRNKRESIATWLSSASRKIIKKNKADQTGAPGNLANAAGQTTKTRPNPGEETDRSIVESS